MYKPRPIKKVIECFCKIPGIGPRMAERSVFFLIREKNDFIDKFASSLLELKSLVRCQYCHAIAEKSPCDICSDTQRDFKKLAVVESFADAEAIERTKKYNGLYFILGNLISPLDGIYPRDIPLEILKERIKKTDVEEVIIATDPNTKGEATALFLIDGLKDLNLKITRLAYGLPFGGDLEYADELTLSSAIESRRDVLKKTNGG